MKPLTKEDFIESGDLTKSDHWKIDKQLVNQILKNQEAVKKIKERIKELQYQLDRTHPTLERSISLQESMQEMSNLIGFEEYEKIIGEAFGE